MSEKEAFAIEEYALGFTMDKHARFLGQPSKSPNIVIADKEMHGYAFAGDFSERLQERAVLLFALVAPEILAPKVKILKII